MKSKVLTRAICFVYFLLINQYLQAATNAQLEQRIIELERKIDKLLADKQQQQRHLQEQELRVDELESSYESRSNDTTKGMTVSGYADIEYRGSNHDGRNEEFRMHHLSLFFTKQFDDNIKFFSEIEYEDTPKFSGKNDGSGELSEAEGKIFVEAVNFDWVFSQALGARAGRFFAPVGIWSEDHYPPFVTTQERPLHIRKIFPQLVDGASIFGNVELGDNNYFDYNLFIGNGESNVSGKKDLNSSKAVGFRGNYHAPIFDEFMIGFSLYQDGRDSSNNDADKQAYGMHFKTRYKSLTAQFEHAKANLDFPTTIQDSDSDGYYLQLSYAIDPWNIGVRYDFYDRTDLDIEEVSRNTLFANYRVNENVVLKGEYHYDDHRDPSLDDYGFYIFSLTAFLGR